MADWRERWEVVGSLETAKGGQGTARLVRRRASSDPTKYVLKELHDPGRPPSTERLAREIRILQRLDGAGTPRIEDFDPGAPSWYVMELVPGGTLAKAVGQRRFTLTEGLRVVERLLDTLRHCHAEGVVHRDIKPANVLLRDGDRERPALIDFGIAADAQAEDVTRPNDQLGNKFLWLPETHAPGANKRDPRSDLTACCGILFYVLTGEWPVTLDDVQAGHRTTE